MKYNKESFKKALKECGIIRWENHFEKVVKAYLKAETEQLTIPVVVKSFICDAEEKGGSRCETQCLGCDGFQRMDEAN